MTPFKNYLSALCQNNGRLFMHVAVGTVIGGT